MEQAIAPIAATIGETARARMLYSLMDNHARTGTELAVIADVTPSTASVHLQRLKSENLVQVLAQGKHRYYSPRRLCEARTCYDHIAGTLGVLLHHRLEALGVISAQRDGGNGYDVTATGVTVLDTLGIDLEAARTPRRRLAFACLDWSVRRPHLGGVLGAALLRHALKHRWVVQDLDSRALGITTVGRRQIKEKLGLQVKACSEEC